MRFLEWLKKRNFEFFEGIRHHRPELVGQTVNRLAVNVGDIIEMGPETQFKGKYANRLAKVLKVTGSTVEALDLTKPADNLKIMIPVDELYNKEDLLGRILYPADEKYLKQLGGNTLWVRLTPRQYKKFKAQYRAEQLPEFIPSQSDERIPDALKKLFSSDKDEDKDEDSTMSIFDPYASGSKNPSFRKGSALSSYISRKKRELGEM